MNLHKVRACLHGAVVLVGFGLASRAYANDGGPGGTVGASREILYGAALGAAALLLIGIVILVISGRSKRRRSGNAHEVVKGMPPAQLRSRHATGSADWQDYVDPTNRLP